jgi:hypothetical protein
MISFILQFYLLVADALMHKFAVPEHADEA